MLYWFFKLVLFRPVVKVVFRPWITGAENIPPTGAAILVSNHLSTGDTYVLPAMIRRRLTFPAKAELFTGNGFLTDVVAWFLKNVGMLPMDRSGGRASASSMDGVLGLLAKGELLGIYPEGTRSPDGRLYKGKTGVARLVLQAGVPVIPVGMIDSQYVPSKLFRIPIMRKPGIKIGLPMDFSRYAVGTTQTGRSPAQDREVLRWVTDEIMTEVMKLSGQTYVDAYGASVKAALAEGKTIEAKVLSRPGEGNPVPPLPQVTDAAS
ncbi:MAG TPA: lysophospholipid acyltransferase family protein [Propionibacteriaceae bacterium]